MPTKLLKILGVIGILWGVGILLLLISLLLKEGYYDLHPCEFTQTCLKEAS